jgi:hypothetical protein
LTIFCAKQCLLYGVFNIFLWKGFYFSRQKFLDQFFFAMWYVCHNIVVHYSLLLICVLLFYNFSYTCIIAPNVVLWKYHCFPWKTMSIRWMHGWLTCFFFFNSHLISMSPNKKYNLKISNWDSIINSQLDHKNMCKYFLIKVHPLLTMNWNCKKFKGSYWISFHIVYSNLVCGVTWNNKFLMWNPSLKHHNQILTKVDT